MTNMAFTDRQEAILKELRSSGNVGVKPLAFEWGVTTQTVRRDLAELCKAGLAMRTRGGARRMITSPVIAYEDRRLNQTEAKTCIADAAAALIPNGASLAINIGTTTEMVAEALRLHEDLTVISNNINMVPILRASRLKSLFLIGGDVRLSDGAIISSDAIKEISNYKFDFAVIGASSLDADGSILDFDQREVLMTRAIVQNARKTILVMDVSKFELSAPFKICDAKDLDYVILNASPPPTFENSLLGQSTTLIIAREKNARTK
tara:strand:- start:88 stop:879 length:792 start_codon:yes stop_codon:yes gene_type:complete